MDLKELYLFLQKKSPDLFLEDSIEINGLADEGRDFLLPILIENQTKYKRPVILVCENEKIAKSSEAYYQSLGFKACYFPSKVYSPYGVLSQSLDIACQRQSLLYAVLKNEIEVLLMTSDGLQNNLLPVKAYEALMLSLTLGESYDFEKLKFDLISMGYQAVKVVENQGEFSFRGEIFDIYPIGSFSPLRIEFFDSEIEKISHFDEMTQLRVDKEVVDKTINILSIFTIKNTKENQLALKQGLIRAIENAKEKKIKIDISYYERYLLEDDEAFITQAEALMPLLYPDLVSVLDYFDVKPLVIINHYSEFERTLLNQVERDRVQISSLEKEGQFLPFQEKLLIDENSITKLFQKEQFIVFSYLPKESRLISLDKRIFLSVESLEEYNKDFIKLKEALNGWKNQENTLLLGYKTLSEKEAWKNFLKENDISYSEAFVSGKVCLLEYDFSSSLLFHGMNLIFLSYASIFTQSKRKKVESKRKESRHLLSLEDLDLGDYIVHEAHGIGIYAGIEHVKLKESENDYLILQYKGNDRLLVPIQQIKQLQKYQGEDGKTPRITNLSSKEWAKTKAKVKGAVEDIAKALLQVSAERKLKEGFAFHSYQDEEERFKAAFPYIETPDQDLAIRDTLRDMTLSYPMDRIICGDVGYGKTEVAMRAAYRAVLNHKQVVVLVPTTVLCEQHYRTFMERFSEFGVEVCFFNRFTSKKEEKEIIEKLKKHQIDIIIGTHKLLSDKIEYADLGLLVIDEEQRFGVKHKEKIKALKTNVDILTLSATPIPRTLHMSMVGIRDVSLIETPPQNRQPIQTYIIEHQINVIIQAIQRELSRGGQVYYVRNHVSALDDIKERLNQALPNAKIGIAHGQMKEAEIEGTILAFINKEIDILVCTTIIETGIDISNANTLIVEHADNFGLSQLYQLRGRVGRSAQVAYAYLTYAKDKVLTDVSEKRLMALKQYTALGSGHKIALRDLKIRGSGNILGKEQSGQMLSVGFELYMYMLEETILALKGEKKENSEVELQLKINAFIAEDYIKELSLRLSLYKQIYAIKEIETLAKLYFETIDRFGEMPKETARLFSLMKIKLFAEKAYVKKILRVNAGYEVLFYEEKLAMAALVQLVEKIQAGEIKGKFIKKEGNDVLFLEEEKGRLDILAQGIQKISSIVNKT